MQAIVLAAGMGRRLGELTRENTKCMIEVNGVRLIDRLLSQLSTLGLTRIILVVGYKGAALRRHVGTEYAGLPIEYIENPIYDKTNNIYSLALAKESLLQDDTLLVESDLIFDDSLFPMLLESPCRNAALVAKYESWMDGTMVRLDEENNIVSFIPKKAFKYADTKSYYKTVNIYKFSKEFSADRYVPFLDAYTRAMGTNEYYEQVLRVITLLDRCDFKAIPLCEGQKWYEIDDVQDLRIAETLFADTGDRLQKYQRCYGGYWRFPAMLDFCYLVNPYFPSDRMVEEMKANFETLLREYPSGMEVNSMLGAKYFGVRQECVCVGNGAAELIKSLMGRILGKIGIVYPTFEEYPNRMEQDRIVAYLPDHPDFAYTARDLMDFFGSRSVEAILLINPDNPSGNFIPKERVLELATWCAGRGIRLIVDESFVDFSEDYASNSLLCDQTLDAYPDLVVMKSISKSYGVPGLRLGIAASADAELIAWMKKDVSIWNINSFAEFYMQIFGKYEADYRRACGKFIEERARFCADLRTVSFLRVIPSQANYFLCEVKGGFTAHELTELLLDRYHLFVKDCTSKKGFSAPKQYIRIAVRDRQDNERLVEALTEIQTHGL